MKEKQKVMMLGAGAFSPILWVAAEAFGVAILAKICSAAFLFTWIYMLVDVLRQRRWDSSKKLVWFAAIFLFGFITVPAYWWIEMRSKQKWRDAYERVSV